MSYNWPEYFDWLHERRLKWPQLPPLKPVASKASDRPLPQIRVVLWDLYGTLLRISDGTLLTHVADEFRMQIALEKTLEEFSMWQSMTRKPGAPWEYLNSQFQDLLVRTRMQQSCEPGNEVDVELSTVWGEILRRLLKKEYSWDHLVHGDRELLSQHIAFFYHHSLQAVELTGAVCKVFLQSHAEGIRHGLFADTQQFSIPHLLWLMQQQNGEPLPKGLLDSGLSVLSSTLGVRKGSQKFYKTAQNQFAGHGIEPEQVLYISPRLRGDLDGAKQIGWKTALWAADSISLQAVASDLKQPELKPDRLINSPEQILTVLSLD